jgi:hypothetical protein
MHLDLAFVIRFLLAVLAVYRLAMFTREAGPFGIFTSIRTWLGKRVKDKAGVVIENFDWTLAEVSNCPHCIGVWMAVPFSIIVIWPNTVTDIILIVLALAGLQSYLTGREE